MRLPATFDIPVAKLTHFLLNRQSRKPERAAYFLRLGFDATRPHELAEALYRHAVRANHAGFLPNAYGYSVIFEGPLSTPSGPAQAIRTVWQVDGDAPGEHARFVTAYRYRRASGIDSDGETLT